VSTSPASLSSPPLPAEPVAEVAAAIAAVAAGDTVLIEDDGGGHLAVAADRVQAGHLAFMARDGRGPLSLALGAQRCAELGLEPPARPEGSPPVRTIASIDAADGMESGNTAAGWAHTARVAADPERGREDILEGGHVGVVVAAKRGVMMRPEAAEAAVDLARLGSCYPAAVICPVLVGGSMATGGELSWLARRDRLRRVKVSDLLAYRWRFDRVLERDTEISLPTAFGDFRLVAFHPLEGMAPHLALLRGEVAGAEGVPLSIQRECRVGNALRSRRCGCRQNLETEMGRLGRSPRGILLHLSHEAPSGEDFRVGSLRHLNRTPCDSGEELGPRRSGMAAQMLSALGVASVSLLGAAGGEVRLREFGVEVFRSAAAG
jgi:3,4-dihydroxy 2-butanone 4-phosphate synthase/GTP cyclohydrolase II